MAYKIRETNHGPTVRKDLVNGEFFTYCMDEGETLYKAIACPGEPMRDCEVTGNFHQLTKVNPCEEHKEVRVFVGTISITKD